MYDYDGEEKEKRVGIFVLLLRLPFSFMGTKQELYLEGKAFGPQ
jgi:hypothetical protein